MITKISIAPCCWRFKESVKDGIIEYAGNYDETEWIISDGDHIYYCPYCGSYIKGVGFGIPPKKAEKITEQEYTLLREIIIKYKPELEHLLDILGIVTLTSEQKEGIHSVLAKELNDNGLAKEDEPNKYGLIIIDLIGKLMYFYDVT